MTKRSFNTVLNRSARYVAPIILVTVALVFDVTVIPSMYRQLRASYYSPIEGRMTKSRIDGPNGKGSSYRADLAYTYAVNLRQYSGTTWRFAEGFALNQSAADAIVRGHPINAPVTVYYDPKEPASSLLSPGLQAGDLLIPLLLLPLNLLVVVVTVIFLAWLRRYAWLKSPNSGR